MELNQKNIFIKYKNFRFIIKFEFTIKVANFTNKAKILVLTYMLSKARLRESFEVEKIIFTNDSMDIGIDIALVICSY